MASCLPRWSREGSQSTGLDPEMYGQLSYPLTRTTLEGLEIKLENLTDMLPLLQATQNPPPELGSRSLVYDSGPWKGDNLLVGIEREEMLFIGIQKIKYDLLRN